MTMQPQWQQVPAVPPTSGYATASLIMGILGLCTVLPSILAVLFGHMALKETRDGFKGGHGLAVAGLILGYVIVVPVAVMLVITVIGAIFG